MARGAAQSYQAIHTFSRLSPAGVVFVNGIAIPGGRLSLPQHITSCYARGSFHCFVSAQIMIGREMYAS